MIRSNTTLPNFVGGELSPFMEGRIDLDLFARSLSWCENFVVIPQGGASYRAGHYLAGLTKSNLACTLIPFQFSANDAYVIAATDQKFRFYRNNGVILNTAKNITGITKASVAVVSSTSHGFSNGTEIFITGVEGMEEINNRFFLVANAAANTFELQDQFGTNVDSQLYSTYTSGGTAASIFELSTPFVAADLALLRYAQTGDLMYFASRSYDPHKLTRTSHTSWTGPATFTRTNDPFTSATKRPAVVSFTADGRLTFASTADNPEGVWESRGPSGATTRYEDFTVGTADTDAVIFNFSPVEGLIDSIQELKQVGRHLVLLGASSIRKLFGANKDVPPTPSAINAHPTIEGSARVKPIVVGGTMLFVDVSGKLLKGYRYNLGKDDYEAQNYQLVAEHLGEVSFSKVLRVKGVPDTIWVLRSDGALLSFTFNDNENIAGWARHSVGGSGIVEDICTIRRDTGEDQLWLVVKRVMGGKTYRSIEVMSAWPQFPLRRRFYTGKANKAADQKKWEDATWERMKAPTFLDMSLTYTGTARGVEKNATLTPSATTGTGITITSNNGVFTTAHIGQQIWKKYDANGTGGGQAVITGYNSATSVTCDVLTAFDSTAVIPPGSWELATQTIKGLHLYEGLTVNIQADGSGHPTRTVANGSISLQNHASTVHVGFGYRGFLGTQNIDIGGQSGPANSKPRNIKHVRPRFKDTCGCQLGPSEYQLQEVIFRKPGQIMGRIPPPFSGVKDLAKVDVWGSDSKQVVAVHEDPTPCTLVALDVEVFTVDAT